MNFNSNIPPANVATILRLTPLRPGDIVMPSARCTSMWRFRNWRANPNRHVGVIYAVTFVEWAKAKVVTGTSFHDIGHYVLWNSAEISPDDDSTAHEVGWVDGIPWAFDMLRRV